MTGGCIKPATRGFSVQPFLRFIKDLFPEWIDFAHLFFKNLAAFSRTLCVGFYPRIQQEVSRQRASKRPYLSSGIRQYPRGNLYEDTLLLACTNARGRRPFGITQADRLPHLDIIGKTSLRDNVQAVLVHPIATRRVERITLLRLALGSRGLPPRRRRRNYPILIIINAAIFDCVRLSGLLGSRINADEMLLRA